MQVPILKQGAYLIATVQSALTDEDLKQLRDTLVLQVSKVRARGVIVDVTALDVIDSFATRTLRDVAYMIRLRGAETVIVGIQPEVAFSMVKLGLTLEGVATSHCLRLINAAVEVVNLTSPGRGDGEKIEVQVAIICFPGTTFRYFHNFVHMIVSYDVHTLE